MIPGPLIDIGFVALIVVPLLAGIRFAIVSDDDISRWRVNLHWLPLVNSPRAKRNLHGTAILCLFLAGGAAALFIQLRF